MRGHSRDAAFYLQAHTQGGTGDLFGHAARTMPLWGAARVPFLGEGFTTRRRDREESRPFTHTAAHYEYAARGPHIHLVESTEGSHTDTASDARPPMATLPQPEPE
jgi:hypothetical protein